MVVDAKFSDHFRLLQKNFVTELPANLFSGLTGLVILLEVPPPPPPQPLPPPLSFACDILF
jgi:hypothetical protein